MLCVLKALFKRRRQIDASSVPQLQQTPHTSSCSDALLSRAEVSLKNTERKLRVLEQERAVLLLALEQDPASRTRALQDEHAAKKAQWEVSKNIAR